MGAPRQHHHGLPRHIGARLHTPLALNSWVACNAVLPRIERKLPKYSNLFDTSTPETQRLWSEIFSLKEPQFLFKLKPNQCDIAPHQGFARPAPPETGQPQVE